MNSDRAAEELRTIRQLMERPVRYSTMSGLSGILAGAAALAGCAADWHISLRYMDDPHTAMWLNLPVWAAVFLAAFASATILTRMRERKRGMPFWSPVKRRILMTILPPFVAGVGLTAVIVSRWYLGYGPNQWGLIPAVWMLFYGVACWQVGGFSVREVRLLGAAFIAAGLIAGAFLQPAPYLAVGLTFGGFHIIYGIAVWLRHGG
jgi:hypothetical protein